MLEMEDRVDAQREAEAAIARFHDQLGPFVAAAETTRMPMVFTNAREPHHPIVFANNSFLRLLGYPRAEVLGRSFHDLMARGTDVDVLARVEAEFKGNAHGPTEVEYRRKDGSTLWAGLFIGPVRDAAGELVQHFASLHDLTHHRDAQAQSRVLINELNHRVKNTLATVQGIVSRALRTSSDPRAAKEAIEARLIALSRSHDLLTRENWTSTGLQEVVGEALRPFGTAKGQAERFTVKGENIRVPPKSVLALSIALHELATNAVKHGAFSNNEGHILIEWWAEPSISGKRLILCWREIEGPPVTPPAHRGFGSQVIERGLAQELECEVALDYRAEGLVCTIDMPAP